MPKKAAAGKGKVAAAKAPVVDEATAALVARLKKTFADELRGHAAPTDYASLTSAVLASDEPPKKLSLLTGCAVEAVGAFFRAVAAVQWTRIEEIALFKIDLGVAGVEALSEAIRSCPKLGALELIECGLSARTVAALPNALLRTPVPPLARLRLDGNTQLGAEGCALIMRALCLMPTTLRELYASNCGAGEEGAERLALFVRSRFCRLETLSLDRNAFGERGMCLLAEAVARNHSLVTLSLAHNNFTDALTVRVRDCFLNVLFATRIVN